MEKVGLNLPRIELVKKNVPLCVMILSLLLQKKSKNLRAYQQTFGAYPTCQFVKIPFIII